MKTIQTKVIELDFVLTGSIIKRHGPCNKENCICSKGQKYWHGPYYIWTRKEEGKTITRSLTENQVKFCTKAIQNMKKLNEYINIWKNLSLKALEMKAPKM